MTIKKAYPSPSKSSATRKQLKEQMHELTSKVCYLEQQLKFYKREAYLSARIADENHNKLLGALLAIQDNIQHIIEHERLHRLNQGT